jgi:hypothetical protein
VPKHPKSAQFHPSAQRGAFGPEDTPEHTSADEPALLALIESLDRKYRLYEDVAVTAYTELLAEHGPVFPLSALVEQAKRVYWRQQADRRRHRQVEALEDISELDENGEPVASGVVITDRRSPEAQVAARASLRRLGADPGGRLLIERELSEDTVSNAISARATRAKRRLIHLRRRFIFSPRHGRRSYVLNKCRRHPWARWR